MNRNDKHNILTYFYFFISMKTIDYNKRHYESPLVEPDSVVLSEVLCTSPDASTEEFNDLGNFEW